MLRYYVGVLAATILFIATNAGLIGISRLSWSLAEHRQLPGCSRGCTPATARRGSRSSSSRSSPVLLIPRARPTCSGNLYSFGAMLSFTTAHVAVVALRVSEPDLERPYRAPWNVRFRGADIPLSAVLGGLGTFAAWVSVVVLHSEARTVGIAVDGRSAWAARPLPPAFGARPGAPPKIDRAGARRTSRALDYRTALVPIFGDRPQRRGARAPRNLIGDDATVYAVYVIVVPRSSRSTAGLEARRRTGARPRERSHPGRRAGSMSARACSAPAIPGARSSRRRSGIGRT